MRRDGAFTVELRQAVMTYKVDFFMIRTVPRYVAQCVQ